MCVENQENIPSAINRLLGEEPKISGPNEQGSRKESCATPIDELLDKSIVKLVSQTIDARNSLVNQNSLQVKKKLDFSRLSNP